jgi:alpha-galactosidase
MATNATEEATVPAAEVMAAGEVGAPASPGIAYLRRDGACVVLDCRRPGLPRLLHWGADLGALSAERLADLALAGVPPAFPNLPDEPMRLAVLPEGGVGWPGLPGLTGHRHAGRDWSPAFAVDRVDADDYGVQVSAADEDASLSLALRVSLQPGGVLALRVSVRNEHPELPYSLDGLLMALPVPDAATELLDMSGWHGRERLPIRVPFDLGARVRDSRVGRTGHGSAYLLVAGEQGFGFGSGRVWGVHLAWSGNQRLYAERVPVGPPVLGGGELLVSDEVVLPPGGSYDSPLLLAAHGDGLDDLTHRFHRYLRARPSHPKRPRPVIVNTWEAVYFEQSLERLVALADAAAVVGVERFVLDDGWFLGRRDDRRGLGDWYVDPEVWPDGLHPLVDHVRALGLEFGLWVEPEMISPDSQLAKRHPEWIMNPGRRHPPLSRNQQVLDLANPAAYEFILSRIDALVAEYRLDYLKWDHNRDLVAAGSGMSGAPRGRQQTLALYRLLDTVRARHPGLEIESCAGGGGRIDLGILARTDRVWGSDCIDALERQQITRWTSLLLPYELIGSHVGAERSHATGRRHDLSFRAGTALFGHMGIECDLTRLAQQEMSELGRWVAFHKEVRGLLHSGRLVRADIPDPALLVHGVIGETADDALFAVVAMAVSNRGPWVRVPLPGLQPDSSYRVRLQPPGDRIASIIERRPPWLDVGVCMTGRMLAEHGLQMPSIAPEQLLLLRASTQ